jgi:putative ABC transport system permease protein
MLAQHGTALDHLSPLVRARLEAVNGTPFRTELDGQVLTREQEGDRRFRSRGINLSYRTALSNSERIVSGRPLAASYDPLSSEPPELSLEERFASRLGLRLGDLLIFDVLGVPVEGRVVNFRQVKWNSFQPNFFILFQPGVLEEAPASFLGSISRLDDQQRLTIQNIVVQEFPNVSVIDVTRIVTRILQISDQMSLAIRMMAWLSILVGLVVVYSIARHEVQTRQWELNLLKVLGARFQDVRTLVLLEFGLLGFFAALFGLLLSLAMSYALAWQFFGRLWMLAWEVSVASVIGVSLLSMGVALLAASGTLRQKPLALLRAV